MPSTNRTQENKPQSPSNTNKYLIFLSPVVPQKHHVVAKPPRTTSECADTRTDNAPSSLLQRWRVRNGRVFPTTPIRDPFSYPSTEPVEDDSRNGEQSRKLRIRRITVKRLAPSLFFGRIKGVYLPWPTHLFCWMLLDSFRLACERNSENEPCRSRHATLLIGQMVCQNVPGLCDEETPKSTFSKGV